MGHWLHNLCQPEAVALIVQQVSLPGLSLGYFSVGSVSHGEESWWHEHEAPAPLAFTARRPRETNASPQQPFSVLFSPGPGSENGSIHI